MGEADEFQCYRNVYVKAGTAIVVIIIFICAQD